ncbi:TetR family transcriptional regulator [Nonomuraea sp. NPDC050394]|uniref:TetR family transcriptional regulator n=1 Tax=Nonomuraea sp. NPDC050394 TaxID=3364363 RepID=UPI003795A2D6
MIDTRDRILAAAGELFARQGSQNTSVREIAEALGLTKTAVLYHFRTKADILATLAQPLIDDTDAAVERVAREGGGGWGTVETLLEVYLRHRDVLSTVVANMPALPPEVFERWFTVMNRANEMVAGPSPDLGERVRAIQVVALLSDPVILLADVPTDELRHHILNGARRLLTDTPELPAEAQPPAATGPSGGRSSARDGRGLSRDGRRPGREGTSPSTEEERPTAGEERPAAEERRPTAGGERPAARRRWSAGGDGESLAGGERPGAGEGRPAAGEGRPAGGGQRAAGGGRWSAGGGQRAVGGGQRAVGGAEGALAGEEGGSVGVGEGGRERVGEGGTKRVGEGDGKGAGEGGGEGVGDGRAGGRPRRMSEEMIAEARRLRRNGDTPVSEIARILGVSRATLYRHL